MKEEHCGLRVHGVTDFGSLTATSIGKHAMVSGKGKKDVVGLGGLYLDIEVSVPRYSLRSRYSPRIHS